LKHNPLVFCFLAIAMRERERERKVFREKAVDYGISHLQLGSSNMGHFGKKGKGGTLD
jgi:hypothetical protein